MHNIQAYLKLTLNFKSMIISYKKSHHFQSVKIWVYTANKSSSQNEKLHINITGTKTTKPQNLN